MRIKNLPFDNLPFTQLFHTYVCKFDDLSTFYETDPFDDKAISRRAAQVNYRGNRQITAEILLQFNKQFDVAPASIKNIERLKDEQALAIVTGQQLGVYGGPVYTMYKTITAIHLAKQLQKKLDRPVVPVFWMADEDHDYDEIRSVNILNGEGLESFSLPPKKPPLPPVSELKLPQELDSLQEQLQSALIDTDFSDDLWNLLSSCFSADKRFLDGFADLMSRLFSKHGLVLAGSNHQAVKKETKQVLITAVKQADDISHALDQQSIELDKNFYRQVTLNDSHLFYLNPERGRSKIIRKDNMWRTQDGHEWESQNLIDEINDQPELFSPDVFLRPVVQDRLLPTLGYVGGPGEIAYYGQMKSFYRCFDQTMPIIFPRLSATFIEPSIVRIFNKLPFEIHEYNSRIEDLEVAFVDRTEQLDIEALFNEWKKENQSVSDSYQQKIEKVDPTLQGAAKKVQAHHSNELNELKGKVYRAVKKREQTQLDRIRRIQRHLFPERTLQERKLSGIYYMNKFGLDIWDRLLEELDEKESLNQHKLIYL